MREMRGANSCRMKWIDKELHFLHLLLIDLLQGEDEEEVDFSWETSDEEEK